MATRKQLNSNEFKEFLNTPGAKRVLAYYAFGKQYKNVEKGIVFEEINLPENCSISISLKEDVHKDNLDILIEKNQQILVAMEELKNSKEIEKICSNLSSTKISDIKSLPVRVQNALRAAEFKTLSELVGYTPEDLMKFRLIGTFVITQILEMIHSKGYCLGMDRKKFRLE